MFAPGQNQLLANLSLLLFFKDLSIVRFYDFKKNFRGMCFTVQLSKISFALPFVSNSFAIISCRFLPVKNFFQLFWSCLCFSLAATLISYHIQPAVVKNFFISFLQLFVRRNSFMLSRVFSDVKNFFSFLSINAEGGIWTLARRKPSIPLAGAPLQPLEYFSKVLKFDKY